MDKKEGSEKEDSGSPVEAHFVTYNQNKPIYEKVCICQYLADLDALFEIPEDSKPAKE